MNNHNLEQIFKNYIDNFEFINSHVPKNEELLASGEKGQF